MKKNEGIKPPVFMNIWWEQNMLLLFSTERVLIHRKWDSYTQVLLKCCALKVVSQLEYLIHMSMTKICICIPWPEHPVTCCDFNIAHHKLYLKRLYFIECNCSTITEEEMGKVDLSRSKFLWVFFDIKTLKSEWK